MTQGKKHSTPRLLSSLEEVAKTRTPIFYGEYGYVRIKLDTDVNEQEWYVIEDDSKRGGAFTGEVPCWAFPHWCGSHDMYRYVPVAFCFKTFASLLEEYPQYTKYEGWFYDEKEYTQRLEHARYQDKKIGRLEETSVSFSILLGDKCTICGNPLQERYITGASVHAQCAKDYDQYWDEREEELRYRAATGNDPRKHYGDLMNSSS